MPPEEFQKCRILEVRDDLETVVLNAGYRNGVRVNLTMVVDGVSGCVLKVVAVRPFVSAAVLESGTLQELVPGMEAQLPGKTVQKTK